MDEPAAYTALQVAKHNSIQDAWLIMNGKVLDVTPFLHDHPGGDVVLLDTAGRDATRDFEDVGHSADAHTKLDALVIGVLRHPTADELRMSKSPGKGAHDRSSKDAGASVIADASRWMRGYTPSLTHVVAASAALLAAVLVARRLAAAGATPISRP